MERFVKGDVVVLPFPFTDLSTVKKRPALVVSNSKDNNLILCQITSQQRKEAVSLKKEDFSSGLLKQSSFIIPSIIFTIEEMNIEYRAGKLKKEKIKEVQDRLVEIFSK